MTFPTKTVANFLSDEEIGWIYDFLMQNTEPWLNYDEHGVLMSTYYQFDFYAPRFSSIYDIMWPRIQKHFGDIFIGQIHVFDSIVPYHVHSDVESGVHENPAWTFIIPLDDYDSHTVVFNEGSCVKNAHQYIKKHQPHDPPLIDDKTYKKYFSHLNADEMRWFSIEQIFAWRRGHLFAANRWKFHTSDNYLANSVSNKRAIVAWTNTQRNDLT